MVQEKRFQKEKLMNNKELLLKDLLGKYSYRVKIHRTWIAPLSGSPEEKDDVFSTFDIEVIESLGIDGEDDCGLAKCTDGNLHKIKHYECKPYLRSLSTMTTEEKEELRELISKKLNGDESYDESGPWTLHDTTGIENIIGGERFYFDEMSFIYDWLDAHYFDYRGLISLGLALEASDNMYELLK